MDRIKQRKEVVGNGCSYPNSVFGIGGAWLGGTILGLGMVGAMAGMVAGSYLGRMLFPQKSEGQTLPKIDNFQIQTTLTGAAIPVVYGTCRLAGNIVYIGDSHPYAIEHKASAGGGKGGGGKTVTSTETRYRRSFLIGICEGPANLSRVWKGKTQISIGDLTFFRGDGNSGLAAATGLEFGHYKNLCCAWFEEYDLGNSDSIPSFTFEVNRVPPYLYCFYVGGGGNYMPIVVIFNDDGSVRSVLKGADYYSTAYNILKHSNGYAYFTVDHQLFKTDLEGNPITGFGVGGAVALEWGGTMWTLRVDASGYLYVMSMGGTSTTGWPTIHKIHPDTGAFIWQVMGHSLCRGSRGGYFHKGYLYATTDALTGPPSNNRRAIKINPINGSILKTYIDLRGAQQLVIDSDDIMYTCGVLKAGYNMWKVTDVNVHVLTQYAAIGDMTLHSIEKSTDPMSGDTILFVCGNRDATLGKSVYKLNHNLGIEASYDTGGNAYCVKVLGDHVFVLHVKVGGKFVSIFDKELNLIKQWGLDTDMIPLDFFVEDVTGGIPGAQLWLPPDVAKDIMTNTRYGAGISSDAIDPDTFNITRQHCIDNDIQVAVKLDSQQPLLDWLDYINSHYCGYMRIG